MIDLELIKRHPPIPERKMYVQGKHFTICEILREVYLASEDKEVRMKLRIAATMAKKMSKKLGKYKAHWEEGAGFWLKKK